jgi:hypothetical protein
MSARAEALERIRQKCEQYWNEPAVCEAEFHAILEFIHKETDALVAVKQAAPEAGAIEVLSFTLKIEQLEEALADAYAAIREAADLMEPVRWSAIEAISASRNSPAVLAAREKGETK